MENEKKKLKKIDIEGFFLNENLAKAALLISVAGGVLSLVLLVLSNEMTPLVLFEKVVKILTALLLYWAFSHYYWDVMRGLMGSLLFCLMYQEGFLVLGNLWGQTADFDTYLIMGVQGSLYLAAQSMSFLMTIIITVNHFIIDYSQIGNIGNVIFNQISILFKIILYIFLIIINRFIALPTLQRANAGIEYISDFAVVVILICIESQLDNFKSLRNELLNEKRKKAAAHE